jgi:hypothetical protein
MEKKTYTKKELLKEAQDLSEKHQSLKKTIFTMINDLDELMINLKDVENKYEEIIQKIKGK